MHLFVFVFYTRLTDNTHSYHSNAENRDLILCGIVEHKQVQEFFL